jgi:hypothetical protein
MMVLYDMRKEIRRELRVERPGACNYSDPILNGPFMQPRSSHRVMSCF